MSDMSDMSDAKAVFYDWNGGNVWLFEHINAIEGGKAYDTAMALISRAADYHNFVYYTALLLTYVLLYLVVRKIRGRGGDKQYLTRWLGIFIVLTVGFGAEAAVIKSLKVHFAYPRPYVELSAYEVTLRDQTRGNEHRDADDGHHSFPSGHTAFATLLVMSLWPILPTAGRCIGLLCILAVMWSRIALGMHFPADVLGAFLIMTIVVLLVRAMIYSILHAWFRLSC